MSSSITPQAEVIEPQVQPSSSAAESAGSQTVALIPSGDNGPAIEAQVSRTSIHCLILYVFSCITCVSYKISVLTALAKDSEALENDSAFGEDSYMPTIRQVGLKIVDPNK